MFGQIDGVDAIFQKHFSSPQDLSFRFSSEGLSFAGHAPPSAVLVTYRGDLRSEIYRTRAVAVRCAAAERVRYIGE